jgi:hypothetical protein
VAKKFPARLFVKPRFVAKRAIDRVQGLGSTLCW